MVEGAEYWGLHKSPTLKILSQPRCGAGAGAVCLWGLEKQLAGNKPRGCQPSKGPRTAKKMSSNTCHAVLSAFLLGLWPPLPWSGWKGGGDARGWHKEVPRAQGAGKWK